jgi:hypothetical protein
VPPQPRSSSRHVRRISHGCHHIGLPWGGSSQQRRVNGCRHCVCTRARVCMCVCVCVYCLCVYETQGHMCPSLCTCVMCDCVLFVSMQIHADMQVYLCILNAASQGQGCRLYLSNTCASVYVQTCIPTSVHMCLCKQCGCIFTFGGIGREKRIELPNFVGLCRDLCRETRILNMNPNTEIP